MSGCSATVVIIIDKCIYYGYVGDTMLSISKEYLTKAMAENTMSNDLIINRNLHLPNDH
jgi:hypothetical protein